MCLHHNYDSRNKTQQNCSLPTNSEVIREGDQILHICYQSIYNLVIMFFHTVFYNFAIWTILYRQHLLHVCPSCKKDPSFVALPEVFVPKGFLWGIFPYLNQGSKNRGSRDRGCCIAVLTVRPPDANL